MFEFIQLMGLKRILFLVGLILYITVILIILCLPEKKRSSREPDELIDAHYEPAGKDCPTPEQETKNAFSPELETTGISAAPSIRNLNS